MTRDLTMFAKAYYYEHQKVKELFDEYAEKIRNIYEDEDNYDAIMIDLQEQYEEETGICLSDIEDEDEYEEAYDNFCTYAAYNEFEYKEELANKYLSELRSRLYDECDICLAADAETIAAATVDYVKDLAKADDLDITEEEASQIQEAVCDNIGLPYCYLDDGYEYQLNKVLEQYDLAFSY